MVGGSFLCELCFLQFCPPVYDADRGAVYTLGQAMPAQIPACGAEKTSEDGSSLREETSR
jgi:hypothetical protein